MFRPQGISTGNVNDVLFYYQREIVQWALRLGRACIFADCGLGKSFMQIEWARNVAEYTGGKVLILAPLAVSAQTIAEGQKLGVDIVDFKESGNIHIANYEQLHNIDISKYSGVVLDESSIIKNFSGKIRTQILDSFRDMQFKLACTATPSPNDFMELGNHAEFVGAMTREEMLAMYFVHDGGETSKWRIKGHAKEVFWRFISSWAVMITKPSDLGYDDSGFILPPLNYHQHTVSVEKPTQGYLIPLQASTLQERIQERRETVDIRARKCADIVNATDSQFLIWCDRNDEADYLKKSINSSIEVRGSDTPAHKSKNLLGFASGDVQRLISKPSIAGFGMNWQSCNQMAFVGLSDSYESFYQAVRRCWRFGQKNPVDVHVIIAETEGNVLQNIQRKDAQAKEMQQMMLDNMLDFQNENIRATSAIKTIYNPQVNINLPTFF